MTQSGSILATPFKRWAAILAANFLVTLAYVGLALPISQLFASAGHTLPASIWFPASLAALGILLRGWQWMPGVFVGSFLANHFLMGTGPLVAVAESVGNVAGPLVALGVLRLLRIDGARIFDTVGGTLAFVLLPGTLNPAIAALFGTVALQWQHLDRTGMDWGMTLAWVVADACTILTLTPALFMWAHPRQSWIWRSTMEQAGIAALTLLSSLLIFWAPDTGNALQHAAFTLILLPMIWAALRFSQRYTTTLLVMIFLLSVGGTLAGRGSLAMMPLTEPLAGVQLIGYALGVTALIAAALSREREHFASEIAKLNTSLEGNIKLRTRELERSRSELRLQLAFQQSFLDSLPNPVFYQNMQGKYLLCSQAFEQLAGQDLRSLYGHSAREVFGRQMGDLYESQLERLQQRGQPVSCLITLALAGQPRDYIVNMALVATPEGQAQGVAGMMQDITEIKRLERALKENEARFRLMVETLPSPMLLVRRSDGTLLFANDAATLNLALDRTSLNAYRAEEFWHDPSQYTTLLKELDATGLVRGRELQLRRAGGERLWLQASAALTELDGQAALIIAFEDITRSKEREAELYNQATTDALTGVANRRHFLALTQSEIQRATRSKQPWGLLMADLDNFKHVNDTYGHLCGDRVLTEVANALRQYLRSIDLLGRLGGEEFAMFLPNTDATSAREVAERLRLAVQDNVAKVACAAGFPITISIGLLLHEASDTAPELSACLARADAALYAAKSAGRNRVALAPSALH